MRTGLHTRSLALLAGTLALLVPGCSSDDEGTATTAPTTTVAAPLASAACAEGGSVALRTLPVHVAGITRLVVVHVPVGATGTDPLPVVLSFHGAGEQADERAYVDEFTTLGDRNGFVTVYPQGLVGVAGPLSGVTEWDVEGTSVDEPAFVAALLDTLGAKVCIDEHRVYAAGFSNGGAMVLVLACELPDRIAAVASVSGASVDAGCTGDATPVPTVGFHGLDDAVVPYAGSAGMPGGRPLLPVLDVLEARAAINGCTGEPTIEAATPTVERRTWNGCTAPVVLYTLQNHGHSWPGHPLPISQADLAGFIDPTVLAGLTADEMAANLLLTNTSIDASTIIWEFFDAVRPG